MTSSSLVHHSLPLAAGRHTIHNWEYADATARLAAVLTSDDLFKIALQIDDNSLWMLVDESPLTWASLGAVTDDHILSVISDSVLAGAGLHATDNAGPFDRTFSVDDDYIEDIVETYIIDEDDMISNLNTKVPTQQSTKAYVDAAVLAAGTYTDEQAQDAVGSTLLDSTSIDFTYDDALATITAIIKDEYLMDWLGAFLADSTSIDWTYDDGGNAITVAVKDEYVQDTVGAMALDSTSIDFTYDDSGATLTGAIKDEYLMDWLGAWMTDTTSIDWTYNDGANTLVADVKDEYVQDVVGTMFADSTNIDVTYNDAGAAESIDLTAVAKTFTVNFIIDGGGSAITTGIKGVIQVDRACTIISNTVLADQSGSIAITIKKVAYASFPGSLTSIVASAKPTLSSVQKSTDSTLTGWTTSVSAGDILEYTVDSITTCQRITLALKMQAS